MALSFNTMYYTANIRIQMKQSKISHKKTQNIILIITATEIN